jgi:hypothetical protein
MKNALWRFAWMTWIACTLACNGSVGAEELTQGLAIVGDSPRLPARQLQKAYPGIKIDIETALGWKLLSQPKVLLIADREVFEKMTGSPFISAFAVPSQHLIVMLVSSESSHQYVLNETFKHELCHLLLHDHISEVLLPRWLDEGICQWVSGSLGEIVMGRGVAAWGMDIARHPIPLEQLTERFPQDKGKLLLAYEQSRRFVEYLTAHYGKQSLLAILQHLKQGDDIDRAVLATLSKSLKSLHQEWLEEFRNRNVWFIWASQHLYEILFFLGAILTVLAFVRLAIRKRDYSAEHEDEE